MVKKHYQLQLAGGIGYQFYKDKSKVYGKPRNVSMDKLAGNLALSGEYFLTSHWGASARLNWLASSTETYSVKYHDEKWNVKSCYFCSCWFSVVPARKISRWTRH